MRKYLWAVVAAAMGAMVYAQVGAGQLLSNYASALNGAKSLKAVYTLQKMDGAPANYSLELAKPNLARLDTPSQTIVADGTTIVRYDKGAKTYYKEAQSDAALRELLGADEYAVFSPFFDADAFGKAATKSLGTVNRKGVKVNAIEALYSNGKKKVIYYLADNVARQAEISYSDGTAEDVIVINTKSVELGDSADSSLFAFKPPAGSRELSQEEMMSAQWFTNLEEAKKVAAKTNRKIFVDFMATWCGPCKMLDAEVLQTEGFKAYSKKVVFLRIDVDVQKDVAAMYKIEAMPTQMVLNADGSIVKSIVGYGGPAMFYNFLNSALGN